MVYAILYRGQKSAFSLNPGMLVYFYLALMSLTLTHGQFLDG